MMCNFDYVVINLYFQNMVEIFLFLFSTNHIIVQHILMAQKVVVFDLVHSIVWYIFVELCWMLVLEKRIMGMQKSRC